MSPRTGSSFLGYERSDVRAPAPLAHLLRWRHRGSFLVAWHDVAGVVLAGEDHGVDLVPDYQRFSPRFPAAARRTD
ncbi:hypothetical protein [Cellulomonas soli]